MNKEEIEELAFKDRKELANLNELDLLEIIEFLQLDRKQWINQYSTAHNDYVDLQQENQQYKEVIDKVRKLIEKHYYKESDDYYDYFTEGVCLQDGDYNELEDILNEVSE